MEVKEETGQDSQDVETKTKLPGSLVIVTGCVVIIVLMVNQLTHSQN